MRQKTLFLILIKSNEHLLLYFEMKTVAEPTLSQQLSLHCQVEVDLNYFVFFFCVFVKFAFSSLDAGPDGYIRNNDS